MHLLVFNTFPPKFAFSRNISDKFTPVSTTYRALREVDRLSRNPDNAGERWREHRLWHHRDRPPTLELCISGKCEGRANGGRYSVHEE